MIDEKLVAALLDEVEETLDAEGLVGLHDFGWTLRGLRPDLGGDAWLTTCQEAYRHLRARRPLELGWTTWQDFGSGARVTVARDDTPLDFDLDPDAPVDTPMLVLVPARDDTLAR
ncbi:MAG: hypothetical protein ACXVWZ_13660 [Nocardioides sp.]